MRRRGAASCYCTYSRGLWPQARGPREKERAKLKREWKGAFRCRRSKNLALSGARLPCPPDVSQSSPPHLLRGRPQATFIPETGAWGLP